MANAGNTSARTAQDRSSAISQCGIVLETARKLLDSFSDLTYGEWVFPETKLDEPLISTEFHYFRIGGRRKIGFAPDTRLHEIRYVHDLYADMVSGTVHTAGRLLGNRWSPTTNHYIHLEDGTYPSKC